MNDKETAEYVLGESAKVFITENWLDPSSIEDPEFKKAANDAYDAYDAFRRACDHLDNICERFADG